MASPQQLEKVQPALAGRRAKPGEVVIADLRAGPVRGLVAGPGVVDRDPGRLRQPSTKHVAGFIEEALLAMNEQAHDLPRGDRQTDGPQLRHQARHRDLPLMVLGQYKAAQLRPEMAIDPARQRRHNQLSVRCQPALPAIADAAGPQHQILNDEIRVALEARAGRHGGRDDLVFDGHARRHRAAAALRRAGRLRLAGRLHPARLQLRAALQPLSRAISARWAATVCSRAATLPSNRTTSAFSSVGESASRSPGGAILPGNQRQARQGSENRPAATDFAAVTRRQPKDWKGNIFWASFSDTTDN